MRSTIKAEQLVSLQAYNTELKQLERFTHKKGPLQQNDSLYIGLAFDAMDCYGKVRRDPGGHCSRESARC